MLVLTEQIPKQLLCLPRGYGVVAGRDNKRVFFGLRLVARHGTHDYQWWPRVTHSVQRR